MYVTSYQNNFEKCCTWRYYMKMRAILTRLSKDNGPASVHPWNWQYIFEWQSFTIHGTIIKRSTSRYLCDSKNHPASAMTASHVGKTDNRKEVHYDNFYQKKTNKTKSHISKTARPMGTGIVRLERVIKTGPFLCHYFWAQTLEKYLKSRFCTMLKKSY